MYIEIIRYWTHIGVTDTECCGRHNSIKNTLEGFLSAHSVPRASPTPLYENTWKMKVDQ